MSSQNTPQPGTSVTISFTHGSWQWADGIARCHGFDTPAGAARDWESRRTVCPKPAPEPLPAWAAACGQCGRPPGQCLPWCAMNDAPVTRR